MIATLVGGVVNAVLNPILIFGLDPELTGAAIASASLIPIYRHYGGLQKPTAAEFRLGFPAALS